MLEDWQVRQSILADLNPLEPETVPLSQALGRILAEPLFATADAPGFDFSSVDGYAVRAREATPGKALHVSGEQAAGRRLALKLEPETAIRIFTGAAIPEGADAVLMQEDAQREAGKVIPTDTVQAGENIRRKGGDLCVGQILGHPGTRLSPPLLGVLASQDIAAVSVHLQPRVAILATGSELVPGNRELQPGEIRDSNSVTLASLAKACGLEATILTPASDDRALLRQAITKGLAYDVLLICGGMSVGDHDHVRPVLEELGAPCRLWKVRMKPGKPFGFAKKDRCRIFGLPGNPVSAYVCTCLFALPTWQRLSGVPEEECGLPTLPATTATAIQNPGERPHYLRGNFSRGIFSPMGLQESHALFGLAQANALARIPPHTNLSPEAKLDILLLPGNAIHPLTFT